LGAHKPGASRRDACQRYKALDYQGFSPQRGPGVSDFASKRVGF